ncbi:HK97 family phage prohead protease [Solirubrobacter phytolaccae]|uniref:HK97 family phage prohead protease n=1 Tax=Solirubrobacter phytolaccae TaxID=1404360 RepID=A0A9X3NMG1_9ACTN|nr:HK97 family phage prohead protease [Solirubrobacter phytolaccae]MDA0184122.1 HK97 family phage prohead protease [Solirubrobacter phytolaccae]
MSGTTAWRRSKAHELGSTVEHREFAAGDLEIRETGDGTWLLTGYASIVERWYTVGWYRERIARGAFRDTLSADPDVQLLINHSGMPLARTRSNTLTLEERQRGLWIEARLDPEDPDARSLRGKMKRGDIDQMSFAFRVPSGGDAWNDDYSERVVKTVDLHRGDVSVVNQGANPAATAEMRAQNARRAGEIPDFTTRARQELDLLRLGGRTRPAAPSSDPLVRARLEIEALRGAR